MIIAYLDQCLHLDTKIGDNKGDDEKQDSWKKCSDHCRNDATCVGWTYITVAHAVKAQHLKCYTKKNSEKNIKDGKLKYKNQPGSVSGPKDCNEESLGK